MNIEKNIKWAVLVTGWGRNAKDLIEAYTNDLLENSIISLLIYENEPCGAYEAAKKAQIETLQLKRKEFKNSDSYQKNIILELKNRNIDYLFLLNYKYIVKQDFLTAFPNRIINIHPSLFPSFLATKTAIQDALDYGVKISGVTTHIIDDKIDEGIILCQEVIKFKEKDTFDTLYPKFAKKGKKIVVKTVLLINKLHQKSSSMLF